MQSSQFDKVFKENMQVAFPEFIKTLLGIDMVWSEELPDDLQHTQERKPDFLKKIMDDKGDTFVFLMEFQKESELEMIYRMGEYHFMLLRKYRLPIEPYVIFIGRGGLNMAGSYADCYLSFKYNLIFLSQIDYRQILKSAAPEAKVFAILGDFGEEDPAQAVNNITEDVAHSAKGDYARSRHLNQLQNDVLYIKGESKGKAAEKELIIGNLLHFEKLSIADIAAVLRFPKNLWKKLRRPWMSLL